MYFLTKTCISSLHSCACVHTKKEKIILSIYQLTVFSVAALYEVVSGSHEHKILIVTFIK